MEVASQNPEDHDERNGAECDCGREIPRSTRHPHQRWNRVAGRGDGFQLEPNRFQISATSSIIFHYSDDQCKRELFDFEPSFGDVLGDRFSHRLSVRDDERCDEFGEIPRRR